jgi:hypothetical protein
MEAINQLLWSINNKESHEEEPSPVFWAEQDQEEPSLMPDSDINDKILNIISEIVKTNQIYT